jgi:hypothetical protein
MELANKHHLGRKLRRSWLVSYIYIFKLTNYNLRIISTTSGYAINGSLKHYQQAVHTRCLDRQR